MFLVSDGSRNARKKIISGLSAKDRAVGFLLSVIDFEWTVRRAILKLSTAPTKAIKDRLADCHGLAAYRDMWREYVVRDKECCVAEGLPSVINGPVKGKGTKRLWDLLKNTFKVRNLLVHGVSGFIKDEDAERHMLNVFPATDALAEFTAQNGANVFEKIKSRKENKEKK